MGLILLFVFLSPLFLFKSKKVDLFNPLVINAIFHILTVSTYFIIFQFNKGILGTELINLLEDVDRVFVKYFFLQIIGYYLIVLGINNNFSKKIVKKFPNFNYNDTLTRYYLVIIISFSIGFISYIIVVSQIGGLSYLLDNIQRRTSLTAGMGYQTIFIQFMTFGVLLLIYTTRFKSSFLKMFVILILFSVIVLLESTFGGRKDTVYLVFFGLLIYHYSKNKVKILSIRTVVIVSIVIIYFLLMPVFRTDGAFEHYSNNPNDLIADAFEQPINQVNSFSYTRHHLLVLDEFDISDIWLGKSYLDLIYSPIPRTLYEDKPPIDDGVYLRSIVLGYEVEPNMAFTDLFRSSCHLKVLGHYI